MKNSAHALVAALSLLSLGCEEKSTPPQAPKPAAPSSKPTPPPVPSASTPPTATPAPAAAGETTGAVSAGGFTFTLPAGWKSVPPANQMRLAEVVVPDASGDAAKACTIAFSSAGGDVQANIDRWAAQVKDASGAPSKPTIQKKSVAGVNVTVAEMTGSYAGMGDGAPKPDTTLRGAIVEAPDGLLFIKMTGPAGPMAAASPAFNSMIDSMKKQ